MRVVLDTNILISAFISGKGAPARIFDLWQEGRLEIVTAQAALDELNRVLIYPRIRSRLRYNNEQIARFLRLLHEQAVFLEDLPAVRSVTTDRDDDKFLAIAQARDATCIISGDDHLLSVGVYEGITIVTAATFLASFQPLENE